MNHKTDRVDIIIPVYNGYEDLQLCIPSVKKHTDLSKHRVVLINDCSPDKRIRPYLDALADEHVLVIHNEKNLGFSGNVNLGMRLTEDRDVVLLNSDTIVTAKWLEKIIACAYREQCTGTVTPLSNSATLCSVPVMCQDNQIPDGFTVDEYAKLIEARSLHRYPRITVSVGFCMFIKRVLIEDIGYFDAETFGRGYGEENDFCNRAEMCGYHHVMCDDTFIYHKGTASFDTAEKQALLEAHTAILEKRYPVQMENNHLYCLENPDQEIRDNIRLYTKLHNGRKNLLYLIHLDFRERAMSNIGGTQSHVKELTGELRNTCNVFVAARDGEYLNVTAYTEAEEELLRFEIGQAPQFPVFRSESLRHIYEQLLVTFEIDTIHVHHTQDLSLEIYHAANKLGIPVIATLHDYYYACPTILLLDEKQKHCTAQNAYMTKEQQMERCQCCLWEKKSIVPQTDYLNIWRREHRAALELCETLIFPSAAAKNIFLQYYPELKEKCRVIAHGEDKSERRLLHAEPPKNAKRNPALRVRLDHVAGSGQGLNDIKGWAYLEGVNNEETELLVSLTDTKGNTDCFQNYKAARPDIVDAFGDPDALMCGIDLRVSSDILTDGPVRIQVFVKHHGQVYTTGQSFKGEYRHRFGKEDRLNVAFLGGMVEQKGSGMANALIRMEQKEINWFVFGDIGDTRMLDIRQENCFFSGKYKKEEIPQLLSDHHIDIVCILPIWPETFCYTVSEAWMNNIPVLGTDIGAVGDRIRQTGAGWLVSPDASPEEVLNRLLMIRKDREDYQKKKQITETMKHKGVAEMCEEYRRLYQQLPGKRGSKAACIRPDHDFIFQGLALGDPSINGRDGIARLNRLKNENAALKASIEVMKGTISYRMARKIAEANVPLKEPLKRLLRNKH